MSIYIQKHFFLGIPPNRKEKRESYTKNTYSLNCISVKTVLVLVLNCSVSISVKLYLCHPPHA